MKKLMCVLIASLIITVFLPYTALCEDGNSSEAQDSDNAGGLLNGLLDRTSIGGLIEFGGGYNSTDFEGGGSEAVSDIHLTTVEVGVEVGISDWINVETVFLYEDTFSGEETSFNLDVGAVHFGNTDEFPLYLSAGKLFVPFGALLTHCPDDPAVDQPMALLLGEASEKVVVFGYENSGFNLSGYLFDGDMNEAGNETGASFGFDGHYESPEGSNLELLIGTSYISNIADSDGLTEAIGENVDALDCYVGGFAAYVHLGYAGFFVDGEYLTALDAFEPSELSLMNGSGAQPLVWNVETGYNWDWGRNLEMVLKFAGSDETEMLGFPCDRFGFGLNQEIADGVTGSFAFLKDQYHNGDVDGRDDGYTVLGQIAVEF